MSSLVVVDFGAGNVASMVKALRKVGAAPEIVTSADAIRAASRVVVPGVGAFGAAMKEIEGRGLAAALRDAVARGIPVLGVCIGLQVFFDASEESPGVAGLGLFSGTCVRFPEKDARGERQKVPQIGWNEVRPAPASKLFQGIAKTHFYFVHSYYPVPKDASVVAATSDYGLEYACAVEKGRVGAVQFHPEKSADAGLALLANFLRL